MAKNKHTTKPKKTSNNKTMSRYVCNNCGHEAAYDGRCGDGAYLVCGCDRKDREWVNDGRGGYDTNPSNARPVLAGTEDVEYGNPDSDYSDWVFKSDRR